MKTMTRVGVGWRGLAVAVMAALPTTLAMTLASGAATPAAGQARVREAPFSERAGTVPGKRGVRGAQAVAQATPGGEVAPEPWIQEDPADSLYRSARDALNRREFERAAGLFSEIRGRYPRSGYVADSYYFQAFALQRLGGPQREQQALALLDQQRDRHPTAASRTDADQLRQRLTTATTANGSGSAQQACDPDDQELRASALSALISMEGERSLPLLRDILAGRDACSAPMRRQAVFLISRASGDEAVDVLLDLALRNPDPDREVREQAVFWLSRVQTDEAVSALESILVQSPDASVQEQAVFALSRQGSARAVQLLRTYAERDDAPRRVREQAIFWLGKDTENAGPAYLRELFGRLEERSLKEQVVHAIAQAGTAESQAWLMERARDTGEDVEVRKNALFWAGRAGLSLDALRGLYDTMAEPELKEHLIFVISREDEPGSVDALMEIASEESDRRLREQAVFWLGRSDDPRAAEFLRRLVLGGGR